MPGLDTSLHLNMLKRFKRNKSFKARVFNALIHILFKKDVYGIQWGDPDTVEPLRFLKKNYVLPYISKEQVALEIGPGGGRWTRYLVDFKTLYVVDYYEDILNELRDNVHKSNMVFIKNNGTDFPGISKDSVDYIFSFGTFVHLDIPLIDAYLANIKKILKPQGNAIIHYSDKNKIMARQNNSFSENNPELMRGLVKKYAFNILQEDTTTMWHSSIVRFTKNTDT